MGLFWGILGAAAAVTLAGTGSILGVSDAGRAGAGVLTEDPEKFGSVLVLQVLPGTQGIYGFLAAFWVMLKMGLNNLDYIVIPDIEAEEERIVSRLDLRQMENLSRLDRIKEIIRASRAGAERRRPSR